MDFTVHHQADSTNRFYGFTWLATKIRRPFHMQIQFDNDNFAVGGVELIDIGDASVKQIPRNFKSIITI